MKRNSQALEGKADLSAAAACVHVSTYLKEKGIKAPKGVRRPSGCVPCLRTSTTRSL